jgi:Rod binding domain-containing protein
MEINPLQRQIAARDIAPERLAGNPHLTQDQKVTEASRQFESVLLRQILSDSQKTVIKSEFSDDSTAAGIYQDLITTTLADNISKSGAFGLAKTFAQQLNRPASVTAGADAAAAGVAAATTHTATTRAATPPAPRSHSGSLSPHPASFPVKQP